jgi:hypothetical protein
MPCRHDWKEVEHAEFKAGDSRLRHAKPSSAGSPMDASSPSCWPTERRSASELKRFQCVVSLRASC